jgi:hypothetical protein
LKVRLPIDATDRAGHVDLAVRRSRRVWNFVVQPLGICTHARTQQHDCKEENSTHGGTLNYNGSAAATDLFG